MKKTKAITTILAIYFLCFSQTLSSQTNKAKLEDNSKQSSSGGVISSENSELKSKMSTSSEIEKNNHVQPRVDTQGKSFQLDENDMFQGRKEEFLSQLTVKELPVDFPKYEKWMGVRHYNEAITDYYKKHLDILIPSVKLKMSQIH